MSGSSFGSTLTGGIQDISALLPLLGTEQCEIHVSSALTKGYLYAAATPISIFGSLGMARAGFKTLVASISSQHFTGARILTNMGFKPQGFNLSLIMCDHAGDSRYLVESRVDKLLKDLHIDDASKVKPFMKCTMWNIKMILIAILCCISSIAPYAHPGLRASATSTVMSQIRFPIVKAIGGFLIVTMMQLIIQNRILVIVAQSLAIKAVNAGIKELGLSLPKEKKDRGLNFQLQDLERQLDRLRRWYPEHIRNSSNIQSKQFTGPAQWKILANWCNRRKQSSDVEKGRRDPMHTLRTRNSESVAVKRLSSDEDMKVADLIDKLAEVQNVGLSRFGTIVCSALLLVGVLASIAGYIGCFSVIQNSATLKGPLIWLGLEAILSTIRFILWGWNPDGDDLPPFNLEFELNPALLLPTCNKFKEEITKEKILPLVRAPDFLESITAYAGRLERFEHPNLSLYYAITRKRYSSHERVLYIAIFDVAERTTRIYEQPTKDKDVFYSTAGPLEVDLEHNILQIKVGNQIDSSNDPVACNVNIRSSLAKHYRSIMDEIGFRDNSQRSFDDIRTPWTFQAEHLEPKLSLHGNSINAESDIEKLLRREPVYREHRMLERSNLILRNRRSEWIDDYMKWVELDRKNQGHETQLYSRGNEDSYISEDVERGAREVKELLMVSERWMMEVIWFHEICNWEKMLLEQHKIITSIIIKRKDHSKGRKLSKMLVRSRLSSARIRLSEDRRAMEARWKDGLPQKLLDQSVTYFEGCDRWALANQWDLALKSYAKESERSMELCDLRLILGNFLRQSEFEDKAHKYGGKRMQRVVHDWCERMKCRLKREVDEMETRLDCDLDCCHDFKGSYEYFNLVHRSSRWTEIFRPYSTRYIHAILKNIEHWTGNIHVIKFRLGNGDELAEMVREISNMTSLTTVLLGDDTEIGDKARAAFVDVISKNRSIISVCGKELTLEIKETLQRNIGMLGTRTAISFGSGSLANIANWRHLIFFAYSNEARNCFTLRFLAPTKGNFLKLRLCHESSGYNTVALRIDKELTLEHPVPKDRVWEDITLLPEMHFIPGMRTTLNFVFVPTTRTFAYYTLYDIQLLDKDNHPYNVAQVISQHYLTASGIPGLNSQKEF